MYVDQKNIFSFLRLVAVVILLLQCSCTKIPEKGSIPGEAAQTGEEARVVVAKINEQAVYEDELLPLAEAEMAKFKKFGMKKQAPATVLRFKQRALEKLIDQVLLAQAAADVDVPDLDKRVEQKWAALQNSPQMRFYRGRNEAEVRKELRRNILVAEYMKREEVTIANVPEEEIQAYYEKNKETLRREASARVSHVLLSVDESSDAQTKAMARQKIDEARKALLAGADFADTAMEYSDCNSAQAGGNLGKIKRGFMPEEFEKVAFSIGLNKVSDVIETKFGYHVLEVTSRNEAGIPPLEDVREFITKYLLQQKGKKQYEEHVKALRDKAKIEVFLK